MKKIALLTTATLLLISCYCQFSTDYYNRGFVKYQSKDYTGALVYLNKAIIANQNDISAVLLGKFNFKNVNA